MSSAHSPNALSYCGLKLSLLRLNPKSFRSFRQYTDFSLPHYQCTLRNPHHVKMSYGPYYEGPPVQSIYPYEARSKEQKARLKWLFDNATKKRRDEGLPPTPQSKDIKESSAFIINRDWYDLWKKARDQVMMIYHKETGENRLSCEGQLWLEDLYFFHKCALPLTINHGLPVSPKSIPLLTRWGITSRLQRRLLKLRANIQGPEAKAVLWLRPASTFQRIRRASRPPFVVLQT